MINNKWCDPRNISILSHSCLPHLEHVTMCSAATLTNILTLSLSSRGTLTKPISGRSCQTFINMYHLQLEDRIHWIIATLFKNAYHARSLPAFGKLDHAAVFLTLGNKQKLVQGPPVKRVVTCWSFHSEAMLQAALDDVDWDIFQESSSDVSEFTDVALSFVNTLTKQATETITIRIIRI